MREYLELLVDGGAGSAWVTQHLAAIRTAFDKMNGRSVTLGLATPRKPKHLPVTLSSAEVRLLLQAAHSLRDKLLLGLMYATGMRVSEVVQLRWHDIDHDRLVITIRQGKGRTDRQVMLPESFRILLSELSNRFEPDRFVFAGERTGRHVSSRTAQRAVSRAAAIAGIRKRVTPHTLRHAFATHLLENGTDIRFIQKLMGHVKLETTTIYARVAVLKQTSVTSPIDRLAQARPASPQQVGTFSLTLDRLQADTTAFAVSVQINGCGKSVRLDGIVVSEPRPGWVALDLPPLERWQPQLNRLDRLRRERVESPAFYELLRTEIGKRFLTANR